MVEVFSAVHGILHATGTARTAQGQLSLEEGSKKSGLYFTEWLFCYCCVTAPVITREDCLACLFSLLLHPKPHPGEICPKACLPSNRQEPLFWVCFTLCCWEHACYKERSLPICENSFIKSKFQSHLNSYSTLDTSEKFTVCVEPQPVFNGYCTSSRIPN